MNQKTKKPKIICIVGPTASGKSELAITLAKKLNAEIISADSMQIYKNLNIGTAKEPKKQMQNIKHHLIDICDIHQSYSVAEYKKDCYLKIEEILKQKKSVIIVGGTGLYISAVVNNMDFEQQKVDLTYREKLFCLSQKYGNQYVYEILKKLDLESAKNIHPNNLKRVIRAIEYAKLYDKNKSEHMKQEKKRTSDQIPYHFYLFGTYIPRDILYEKIDQRVDKMLKLGLVKEARYVYDQKLPQTATCMQAIGYKEFFDFFEGKKTLEQCVEKLKQDTRHYAKRQITWFKNMLDVKWLDYTKTDQEKCIEIMEKVNG